MEKSKKTMKRILALLFSVTLVLPFALACGGAQQDKGNDDTNVEQPSEEGFDDNKLYAADGYDFGDASTWAGETQVTQDLGDCLIEGYPYDERYDWGQSIMYDTEESTYKMWWCRHSGYDSIWYAESQDLKHWTNAQKIMTVEEDTTWIKMHVGKPSVIKVDGTYVMYLEAPATLMNGGKEFNNNVFRATSSDGINWQFYTGTTDEPYPVIRMSDAQIAASNAVAEESGGYGWYGFGQPSACYVDGTYYVYYTHTLIEGDRFYVTKSTDGVHFDEGEQVFVRAGSGVKYNALTEKFMMAYEYTVSGNSKVYYMESSDGVHFTYDNYTMAANNENVLSKGSGFVRGYPDFVGNEHGQVTTHTAYVSYMEGKMADAGNDWRQYSATWDIHIAAVNVAEFANRAMVLPNQTIKNTEALKPYREAHEPFEDRLVGISHTANTPVMDAVKDDLYENATVLSIDRLVSTHAAIPTKTTANAYVGYSDTYFYTFIEVSDAVAQEGDYVQVTFTETFGTSDKAQLLYIRATRDGVISVTDGNDEPVQGVIAGVERTDGAYTVEVLIPWVQKTMLETYDGVGFDVLVYDNGNVPHWLSILAWSNFRADGKSSAIGELYFKG